MKSIREYRMAPTWGKYFWFLLILFFHLLFLPLPHEAWALIVRLGENVTITEMNFHEAWKEVPAPPSPNPLPPDVIEYWSTGNSAHTLVTTSATKENCEDGQSGNAFATLGVEFYVEGEAGQSRAVEITISFSANAESMVNGGNTADACLWRMGKDGCIHRALCSTSTSCLQTFAGDESVTFSTYLIGGQNFQTGLHIYSHADTCFGASRAFNEVTIHSIKIEFIELTVNITKARMVSPSVLGIDATVTFPDSDLKEGPRYIELKATINGQPVKEQIDVTNLVGPGETALIKWVNTKRLQIDLANTRDESDNPVEIPKFIKNEKFKLEAVAWSSTSGRSGVATEEVNIPLPVIIIHGVTKNLFEQALSFAPYMKLQKFLTKNGYDVDESSYKTLWGPPDVKYSSQEDTADEVVGRLNGWVDKATKATYADKINLIGHSLGGLIGRYYAWRDTTRVNKVIMIGTPSQGSSLFYIYAYKNSPKWLDRKLHTSDRQPNLRNWLPPTYLSLYDYKTGQDVPNPFPFPNLFYADGNDKPAPDGIIYYSIYNSNSQLLTPYELYVTPKQSGTWYSYKGVKTTGWGDGTVLMESANTAYATNIEVATETGHGFLPADPLIQLDVLISLNDGE